jgi:DNA-binding CsgD family transcriptional regulator
MNLRQRATPSHPLRRGHALAPLSNLMDAQQSDPVRRCAARMTKKRSLAALRAVLDAGLSAEVLVPTVLEALHELVPSSRNLFDWTDEAGELVRYFIEGPLDEAIARLYFDEFHNRLEGEAMPHFAALRDTPAGVRSAAELDHPGFFNSALYQEIWRPQGFRYRLEAVLRGSRGQLLGSLVLYRDSGQRCFSHADEMQLTALVPLLARAIERSGSAAAPQRYVGQHGGTQSMLLTLDGQLQQASADAHRLVMLAHGGITRDRLEQPLQSLASAWLQPLLQQLRRHVALGLGGQAAPSLTHENAWGQFTLQARLLKPVSAAQAGMVQVSLVWSVPHRVALERSLRSLTLTPGQLAVCRELYHGHQQAAIGAKLGVAQATVVDHVRKLYCALDVRSTHELRALLDGLIYAAPASQTAHF